MVHDDHYRHGGSIMRIILLLVIIAGCFVVSSGATQTKTAPVKIEKPDWLDTIPPKVKILPAKKYHTTVFMVTLSANERTVFSVGINSSTAMAIYSGPLSFTNDTDCVVYFYGEDDFGNTSALDSMHYILDTRPPRLTIIPESGMFQQGLLVRLTADEPCRFEFLKDAADVSGKNIPDSLMLTGYTEGFFAAIDKAGNRSVSKRCVYSIDTSSFSVSITPDGGLFNQSGRITATAPVGVAVFYSFDPVAPPEWFTEYTAPVAMPLGVNNLRYFGKNGFGRRSSIGKAIFIVDTVRPRLQLRVGDGTKVDTLFLGAKERVSIFYELDSITPTQKSKKYEKKVLLPRQGKGVFWAVARDEAGNFSDVLTWERKYDFSAPVISSNPERGTFTKPIKVMLTSSKPSRMYYTVDGSKPDANSLLYGSDGITLSREGITLLRYIGIDEAGNVSEDKSATFLLDTKPPVVRAHIEGNLQEKNLLVRLKLNEPGTIYYEIGGARPTDRSQKYVDPIALQTMQVLSYFALDTAGNQSRVVVMDELQKPMVTAVPEGGSYNHQVVVKCAANLPGAIYWRISPDTLFKAYKDSIVLSNEGIYTVEYYMETLEGLKSPLKRNQFYIDWTPPRVNLTIKKGLNDSVTIFFESSENASIYYTYDGSNPHYSPKMQIVGNKYLLSKSRISIPRANDVKLAFFSEDGIGNQSSLTVLDVLKPKVVPNVPAGKGRLYDRILSVSLNTYDQSNVYFSRHGRTPTTDSTFFVEPITLMQSDTIVAFAIDGSGFKGELDTFVYTIDLPPSPFFSINPDTVYTGVDVLFDGSASVDMESPLSKLLFRWDFNGDGVFETSFNADPRSRYNYARPGNYSPVIEVQDENKRLAQLTKPVVVKERCPAGMVSVIDRAGVSFCIDQYESPNSPGTMPRARVSWVEAKMACIDAGKRLCTRREWEAACQGNSLNVYPYGDVYQEKRCPTAGKNIYKTGSFSKCHSIGVSDMMGNVWEWVEDKVGDYPVMMGGSIVSGSGAHCGLSHPGTVATKEDDVGFRCCK